MSVQAVIENKLTNELMPTYLQVINESYMHSGPATESHFKVVIVTDVFDGKSPVARHQLIYALLTEELNGPVHALALHTYTQKQWHEQQAAPASPQCHGGN